MNINVLNSLYYYNKLGIDGIPDVFPAQSVNSNYILAEQAIQATVYGLKPGTLHKVFLEGVDVTDKCKQDSRLLGEGLLSNIYGMITFTFYFSPTINPTTDVEKAAAIASLIAGPKVLTVTNTDSSSRALVNVSLPLYVRDSLDIYFKKTPVVGQVALQNTPVQTEKSTSTSTSNYFTTPEYSIIQTFFADPNVVAKSSQVSVTSVEIFVKVKPNPSKNVSGNPKPGITIQICDVENDEPILSKCYASSLSRKEYDEIYAFADASTPVTFGFNKPVKLTTGKFYGIVISCDDPSYEFWVNKTGDKLVGTNSPSPGSNIVKDGKMYLKNNSDVFKAISDTDLKFKINCAKYTETTITKTFVNANYEFFTIEGRTGNFLGGEWVYKNSAFNSGLLSVVRGSNIINGIGTDFTTFVEGDPIVVLGDGTKKEVVFVANVSNSTLMTTINSLPFSNTGASFFKTVVGKVYYKDELANKVYLNYSTANNALFFDTDNTIVGVDSNASANIVSVDTLSIDRIKVKGDIKTPAAGKIDIEFSAAAKSGGSFDFTNNREERVEINNVRAKNLTKYDAHILSRSLEVMNNNLYSNAALLVANKSVKINARLELNTTASNFYTSPSIEGGQIDLYSMKNTISNNYIVTSNGVSIDSEVGGNGAAIARHIANKVVFAKDRFAEDVRMFMTAYRPLNTDIKVYVKVHNSQDPEPFDDKAWTPLEYVTDPNKYSSSEDPNDFIEYELGLPAASDAVDIPGVFAPSFGSTIVAASGVNPTSYITNNDVVKIYNSLLPENYTIAVVKAANTTAITLGSPIASNSVAGNGFSVAKVKYPNIAFNNPLNSNIARYYNDALVEIDNFDSMQVKIVFLSDSTYVIPKIDQIQVIGVSA
jgi:hypothetical protein